MRPFRHLARAIRRKPDAIAIALLVLLITSVFADVIFRDRLFYDRDLIHYYYPTKKIVREQILAGEPPLWNPNYSAGQPMASNPEYEVFYPPQWLTLLPDYHLGFRLHILLHFYVAAIGMYLLLRSRGLGFPAGLFGGIVFSLSGPLLSGVNLLPILFTIVWIPWVLLFHGRYLRHGGGRNLALAALCFGASGLVGEPTSLIQTVAVVAVDTLYFVRRFKGLPKFWRRSIGSVGRSLHVGFAGIGVAAAQLLPAVDHVGDSVRSIPFSLESAGAWSMPLWRPLELVFPHVFGISTSIMSAFWGSTIYPNKGGPFTLSIYLGLTAICFCIGLAWKRPRGLFFGLSVVGISYLLAVGNHTPLLGLLHHSGLATNLRYPEKFFFVALFMLVVGAAVGFDRCWRGDLRVLRVVVVLSCISSLIATVMVLLGMTSSYPDQFKSFWSLPPGSPFDAMADIARGVWAVGVLRGLILAAICLVWLRRIEYRTLAAASVLLFTFIDLIPGTRYVTPRRPREYFAPPPIVDLFEGDRSKYRLFHEAMWYQFFPSFRPYFDAPGARYWVTRNGMFPMTPGSWGFSTVLEQDYDLTHLLPTAEFTDAMWAVRDAGLTDWAERFMAMSNVRYRLVPRPPEIGLQVAGPDQIRPVAVLEGPPYPRYYLADQLLRGSTVEAAVGHFTSETWSLRSAVVDIAPFEVATGSVSVHKERPSEITLDVDCEDRCFLVLANTYHRYWRAWVEASEVPLRRVNLAYQGIEVPAGQHRVRVQYRNPVVIAGVSISLLMLVILTGSALWPRFWIFSLMAGNRERMNRKPGTSVGH